MQISIIILSIMLFSLIALFIYFQIKNNKIINSLNNELIKVISKLNKETKKEKEIIVGLVTKPNEKDISLLFQNQDILNVFIKIIHYEIFKKTEITRGQNGRLDNDTIRENIGWLNAFHYLNLVIDKIKRGVDLLKEEEEVE